MFIRQSAGVSFGADSCALSGPRVYIAVPFPLSCTVDRFIIVGNLLRQFRIYACFPQSVMINFRSNVMELLLLMLLLQCGGTLNHLMRHCLCHWR